MHKSPIRLIIGLGNPGSEYARTRHNAGAWFVERCITELSVTPKAELKFFGSLGRATLGGHDVRFFLPSTYINESGKAVLAITQFFKIAPEEILVAHDDLDHEAGTARLKFGGGHGGHNGLRDIKRVLGSSEFARLRLGIGHPGDRAQVTNYVLSSPSRDEQAAIDQSVHWAYGVLPDLAEGHWNQAVKSLHDQVNNTN